MHFSVAKLLSIAVMTILLRLSPPKPTSSKFVTHTANKLQHATAARAHDARPELSFDVFFLESPTEYLHKPHIARN